MKSGLKITLADSLRSESEIYNALVDIEFKEQMTRTMLFALPIAKDNRSLLGRDFLRKSGTLLDIQN